MTIVYVPRLIESAEQAEALPEGTVLIRDDHYAFQKDKGRFVSADPHDLPVGAAWEVVGWAALVPIEAEEHGDEEYGILTHRYMPPDVIPARGPDPAARTYRRTIFHTPWEES